MSNYKGCCGDNNYPENHYHDEKCRPPYPPPHPERVPVTILSCGNGQGGSLPVFNLALRAGDARAVNGGNGGICQTIGTVSLDANGLVHPDVKIDFSSLINYRVNLLTGYTFRVVFQLSRVCDHGSKTPLGTWVYENSADVNISGIPLPSGTSVDFEYKDPFGFVWCLCNDCPGCCLYTVEVVDVFAYGVECASITNVGITAIASGKPR